MSDHQPSIRQRARRALLTRALLRRESLITLALTALLIGADLRPLPDWQPWYWLVAGALSLAALVSGHLGDAESARQALNQEFAARYEIHSIRNASSRERLRRALEYSGAMHHMADLHQGALRDSLRQTAADVETWIAHMVHLARHIDTFEENDLVSRDLRTVPRRIERTRQRLASEQDPVIRSELQRQLEQLQQQLDNLNAIGSHGQRAVLRLESALASLGTMHAQMALLGTRKADSSGARQMRQEIREEVSQLQDTIEAMDEVQAGQLRLQ